MPCASCKAQPCFTGKGELPDNCPDRVRTVIASSDVVEGFFGHVKANQEKNVDRIHELIEYANFMGYKKIGIAGCIGMHDELRVIKQTLKKDGGLEVSSVMCKSGSVHKKDLGVPASARLTTQTGHAIGVIACNPVGQAMVFNDAKTDLNCVLGLCVGHDSIFMKHSEAPVISLLVKDRANAHNPASILYGFYGDNYFHRRPSPEGASKFNSTQMKPIDLFRMMKMKLGRRK
ncbi:MAG: DUF1847 domain-containing protein [Halieaceae bacterium]|jgi:uncharacterized metal-binding protein|nr:DUF1847 domain-containing protein [Halieaceae bacterium]